jgi:hypothetical protein
MLSQKPYLACEQCNTGWMNDFEEQTIIFAKSLFTSHEVIRLTRKQVRSLCGWLSLIAILAEYNANRENPSIPKIDRQYIKEHLAPPGDWCIFACSQVNPGLIPFHSIIREWYEPNMRNYEHPSAIVVGRNNFDTQLSTFGLGLVALQLFTGPTWLISHFYPRAVGLMRRLLPFRIAVSWREFGLTLRLPAHSIFGN